jgi:cellulose biosynthesis protein BcsQ
VLAIDFDPQQSDLTASLGKTNVKIKLSDLLVDNSLDIHDAIQPFCKKTIHVFDLIASDPGLDKYTESDESSKIQGNFTRLKKLIQPLSKEYDYIIIDSPTNWAFFSKSCVYASDVVLIPTQHDNFASLKNAKKVIEEYLPEIQKRREEKRDYGIPIALPIFFNQHKQTDASIQRAHQEIRSILKVGHKGDTVLLDPDLTSYYYPHATKGQINTYIFTIPQYAIVASAGFSRVPASLTHTTAYQYYRKLAQEYFLDE